MSNNNIDKQKLIDAIVASSGGKLDKSKLTNAATDGNMSALLSLLGAEDKQKLASALSDKESANNLLQSEQAKAILKAFLKGGNK